MSNQVTLQQAQRYFEEITKEIVGSISFNNATWLNLGGVPHLLTRSMSWHFIKCKCGKPDCHGIKAIPGSVN